MLYLKKLELSHKAKGDTKKRKVNIFTLRLKATYAVNISKKCWMAIEHAPNAGAFFPNDEINSS